MSLFDLPPAELATYRPDVAEPEDFDFFWKETLVAAETYDLDATAEPYDALLPGVTIHDVRFSGACGDRVAAWFLMPRHVPAPVPCVIQFGGYGRGRGRPHEWLLWPAAGFATLVMDSRGQGDGDTPDVTGVGPQRSG